MLPWAAVELLTKAQEFCFKVAVRLCLFPSSLPDGSAGLARGGRRGQKHYAEETEERNFLKGGTLV